MALLPIAFLIIFYQLSRAYDYNNIRLTILVVGACLWFRMVLIPLLGACDSSYFNKVNTDNDAVKISLYLCLYESLVISFIIYFCPEQNMSIVIEQKCCMVAKWFMLSLF